MEQVLEHLHHALPDHYLLDREIGRGGMATVYLAQDLRYGRKVAVKVLRPDLAALIGPERFLREIQTTARLSHPNILPLHDSGQANGLLYYVMPYVEGETLRDGLQREGPLPLEDALRIAGEVADALEYAHRQGVVHRDVKPANILLSGEHALVADFGLAKALAATTSAEELSHSGLAVGTPEYMSPEQASGDSRLDGRADVYALGCVLFEMLAGEPPFRGNTAQTILARHRIESIPSVRVLRPDLPAWVEDVIHRALAKTPADRHRSAAKFKAALVAGAQGKVGPARRLRLALAGTAVVAGAFLAWRVVGPGRVTVDSNKVVVFPLIERGAGVREGTGQEIALMIGSALEHTEPLKWIDGWTWLDSAGRADARLLAHKDARAIARRRSARYYLDGVVIGAPDSDRVVLRLNDARGDSVVAQATVGSASIGGAFPQLGLRAINLLLPRLLEPGRRIDLAALAERSPAAIANWLQGERAYRHSHYALALEYQRRAVADDSLLAFAAIKGALAAEWEHEYAEAAQLVRLALRNDSLLPPKYVQFAEGLRDYFNGEADSASRHLQEALRQDSTWSEAWMALGEVRYHLYPDAESLAAEAFTRARRIDPDFAPPLFHLAEIALRSGNTAIAARLIDEFRHMEPDSSLIAQLDLTLDCLQHGSQAVDWAGAVSRHPLEVLYAAKVMGSRGADPDCAEAGFRSVFTSASVLASARWGALLGLQGILTARGRLDEVKLLLDSAVGSGLMAAKGLYVIHAAAGSGMDAQAAAVIAELAGGYAEMSPGRLWYNGIWLAHVRDRTNLSKVAAILSRQAESSGRPLDAFAARSLAARLALLDADTGRAIALLDGIGPAGAGADIEWGMQESFGEEQLVLAELLLASGRPDQALQAASRLDDPRPILYSVYLRKSLLLRIKAAEMLGRNYLAVENRRRLSRLN